MQLAHPASNKQVASKQLRRALSGPQGNRSPEIEKANTICYPGRFSATFSGTTFLSVGPPPVGNGGPVVQWYFGPFWALGTERNSGPGPETGKHNFSVLEALLGGKSSRVKSFFPKLRNFFTVSVLAGRTPRGGKSKNTGFSGHSAQDSH